MLREEDARKKAKGEGRQGKREVYGMKDEEEGNRKEEGRKREVENMWRREARGGRVRSEREKPK